MYFYFYTFLALVWNTNVCSCRWQVATPRVRKILEGPCNTGVGSRTNSFLTVPGPNPSFPLCSPCSSPCHVCTLTEQSKRAGPTEALPPPAHPLPGGRPASPPVPQLSLGICCSNQNPPASTLTSATRRAAGENVSNTSSSCSAGGGCLYWRAQFGKESQAPSYWETIRHLDFFYEDTRICKDDN